MKHITGLYPRVNVGTSGSAAVGQAGGVLLVETVRSSGLDRLLSSAVAPWRSRWRPMIQRRSCSMWGRVGARLGLHGRCEPAARRAWDVRPCRFGPDRVEAD